MRHHSLGLDSRDMAAFAYLASLFLNLVTSLLVSGVRLVLGRGHMVTGSSGVNVYAAYFLIPGAAINQHR